MAGSALRTERRKSTAYSWRSSRRQIQTRSQAYQTNPPVKSPPAPSITIMETWTDSDIRLLLALWASRSAIHQTAATMARSR